MAKIRIIYDRYCQSVDDFEKLFLSVGAKKGRIIYQSSTN